MRRLTLALFAATLIPACGGSGDTIVVQAGPSGPFAPGVVFSMRREVNATEVWGASLDGTQLVRLSGALVTGGNVFEHQWSPDRRWVAFVADKEVDNAVAVYVVPAVGPGVPRRVSPLLTGIGGPMKWAPDSSRIAVLAGPTSDLFTVTPGDPTTWVQVNGTLAGAIVDFAWAPDSSRLAYEADQDTAGTLELYTSLPTGAAGNIKVSGTMVAGGGLFFGDAFRWAPDSSRLAYLAVQDTAGIPEIYTSLPTGAAGNVRVSAPIVSFADSPQSFAWSPDSSRIGYTRGLGPVTLWTTQGTSAAGAVQITFITTAADWAWAPDASRIAFRTAAGLTTTTPTGASPATLNPAGAAQSFRWAPDSSRIAYIADQDTVNEFELYVAPAAGGSTVKVSGPMAGGDVGSIFWSPTSARLVYRADPDGATSHFFATQPTGATPIVQLSFQLGGSPANGIWTTDGSHFVFVSDMEIDGTDELFAADPATGGVLKISGPTVTGQTPPGPFTPR